MVVATKRQSVTNCVIRVVEELTDLTTLGNSYIAALGSERFAIDVLKKVDEFVHQATIEVTGLEPIVECLTNDEIFRTDKDLDEVYYATKEMCEGLKTQFAEFKEMCEGLISSKVDGAAPEPESPEGKRRRKAS